MGREFFSGRRALITGGSSGIGVAVATELVIRGSHAYSAVGPKVVTVKVSDAGGSAATATDHLLVFGSTGGGSFVIGDQSTTGTVQFWGAQWAKKNALSGGSAPSSFKGFGAGTAPACGAGWTADPGGSGGAPATVPVYTAMIVSSSVAKRGSSISGNTVHVVVVKTDPGYTSDPGHPGTGTVVAVIC